MGDTKERDEEKQGPSSIIAGWAIKPIGRRPPVFTGTPIFFLFFSIYYVKRMRIRPHLFPRLTWKWKLRVTVALNM